MPSFKKSLIVEQFQGNYPFAVVIYRCLEAEEKTAEAERKAAEVTSKIN